MIHKKHYTVKKKAVYFSKVIIKKAKGKYICSIKYIKVIKRN